METFGDLLDQSASARALGDWAKLEQLSIEVLRFIYKEAKIDESSLKVVIRNYLSSIVGTGEFLTNLGSHDVATYQEGLRKLLQFIEKRRTSPLRKPIKEKVIQKDILAFFNRLQIVLDDRNDWVHHNSTR
jgi:hypothetical protein